MVISRTVLTSSSVGCARALADTMSASGFAPNVSDTSVQSVSSATSSLHEPPAKQLKALEEAEEDHASAKQLLDSTDEDNDESVPKTECKVDLAFLEQFVASPVPNVPDDVGKGDDEEEGGHEADDFVPNRERETALEPCAFILHVAPEVFEIGEDNKEDEGKQEVMTEFDDVLHSGAATKNELF